ncbi:MAG: DUF4175 domain-containing protein [Alphaproteobacteria bacterium]|nr:DUF4175 domain-containing protein [Alphaproteobacteria bacterium]
MKYIVILAVSYLSLLWERAWNRLWAPCSALLFFIALALLNIPALFDATGQVVFLAVAAAALVAAFLHTKEPFALPTRHDVERHMEEVSTLEHRPLETLHDKPIEGLSGESLGLWQKHLQKAARYIDRLRIYAPRPDVARRDRLALRHAAMILLAVGLVVAQNDSIPRLRQALRPDVGSLISGKAVAFDLWITPPEYTHEAAVFLATTGQGVVARDQEVRVPEGSILKLRLAGYRFAPKFQYAGQAYPLAETAPRNFTLELPLQHSGELRLFSLFSRLGQWPVTATPDAAPDISITGIDATPRFAAKISYDAHDDYGIAKMSGIVSSAPDKPGSETYRFDIPPSDKTSHVEDLTAHPWAGLPVTIRLEAEDSAGHKTLSAPAAFTLPERLFTNPTAKRLIEQRKKLLQEKDILTRRAVARNIAGIADQPLAYKNDGLVFLSLDIAVKRLLYGTGDDAASSVPALLWDVALKLEDGGLSLAQQELRNALQKMSEALNDKNLSKAQLQEIVDDVQKKMQQYVRSLAAELQQRLQQGKKISVLPPDLAQKFLKNTDLRKMLEQMRLLAQMNSREDLQKMADDLKDAIDNIDMKKFDQMQERQIQAMEALQGLEDIIHAQQALFDKSNKSEDPADAKEGAQEQGALRRKLGALVEKLGNALDEIPDNFAKASQSMKQSEAELGKGRPKPSLPHQKAALEELRKGLDSAVEKMAKSMQQSILSFGMPKDGGSYGEDFDPLGRNLGEDSIKIPDEKERRRVQEIIEELRRRSNDPNRARAERDYIDRLLDQF